MVTPRGDPTTAPDRYRDMARSRAPGTRPRDTTGAELPPLQGVADLHLHMFAEEAFGGGWFHGSHTGPGDVALAPCDGGEPGDHARLQDDLAPLLGTCEGITLEELGAKVPLVAVIAADGGGAVVSEFVSTIPGSTGDTGSTPIATQGWPELAAGRAGTRSPTSRSGRSSCTPRTWPACASR
jgi:hypothetical protein